MMVPIVITAIVTLLIAVPVTALIASAQCKKGIEQKIIMRMTKPEKSLMKR